MVEMEGQRVTEVMRMEFKHEGEQEIAGSGREAVDADRAER